MEEIPNVKVVYGEEEFELTEQELDRIVAIASKKLRNELISMKLGFMPVKKNELRNENDVRVLKNGYESELYKAMSETLVYAIETDMLGNYCTRSLPFISQNATPHAREVDSKIIDSVINIVPYYTKHLHENLHEKFLFKPTVKII